MYTLIINPESGQGAALANLPAVLAVLDERKLEYQLCKADSPEEATEYARRACAEKSEGVRNGQTRSSYDFFPLRNGK